ncbi:hypothetical protein N9W89_01730 [Hellea sp.]|nr:hypothetical protein [Hellea sp.]
MSSFALYFTGVLIVVAGLVYAAITLGLPQVWIGIGAVIIIGFGLMGATRKTRLKDETPTSE